MLQETVYRYGVKKEFLKAEADTMKEVLAELRRRYRCTAICMYYFLSSHYEWRYVAMYCT